MAEEEKATRSAGTPVQRVVVVRGGREGFTQQISAGDHRLVSDEPVSAGGANLGPTPYDLLLSALGSCTSITLSMYARRRGWPLEGVTVTLRHQKVHAADCADCDTKVVRLDRIDLEIGLAGALSEVQRARLLEIAGRCPVHQTLTSQIDIATKLV
jgi:putative redox protein